uniref:Uncharacterized protein n=1 Tax=Anopheles farauti TaxID=69004 RepID=A0A9I3GIM7_9DIPT
MVLFNCRWIQLSVVLVTLYLAFDDGCFALDISKCTLDTEFYLLFACARDLEVPDDLIALYSLGIFPDDQKTSCVYRCLGMQLGIYDDVNGLDVDKQYERLKESLSVDESTYKRGVKNCIRNILRGRTLNDCERAYLIMTNCQGDTITNTLGQQLNEIKICD